MSGCFMCLDVKILSEIEIIMSKIFQSLSMSQRSSFLSYYCVHVFTFQKILINSSVHLQESMHIN